MVQNFGNIQKVVKVGKISFKYDILTVEEKLISLIGNKTKRSLETNPWQIELDSRRLKESKIHINKIV